MNNRLIFSTDPQYSHIIENYGDIIYQSKLNIKEGRSIFGIKTSYSISELQELLRFQTGDHKICVREEVIGRLSSENHKFNTEHVEKFEFPKKGPIIEKILNVHWKPDPDKIFPLTTERERQYQIALMEIDKILIEAENSVNFMDFGQEYISDLKKIIDELNLYRRENEHE